MAEETPMEVLRRYLEDAIAAEKNFEAIQLKMAKQGDLSNVQQFFREQSDHTRTQHERLTWRLEALGGHPSAFKSLIAEVFNFAPPLSHFGFSAAEKSSHDLLIAFAIANSEVAMYEQLAVVAALAGDVDTEHLAREIQQEERRAAENVWNLIAPASLATFTRVTRAA